MTTIKQLQARLRVVAEQLQRLDPEDRAALRPYVERDMARHMTDQSPQKLTV